MYNHMKPADNFDLRKFITEGKLLKENMNEGDLKMYYDILMDIGDEDLAGEYKDLAKKSKQYKSFAEFIKNDLEVLNQDDPEQVFDIKFQFVSDKLYKMSPKEFTTFLKKIDEYDLWVDGPEETDPINDPDDRVEIWDTFGYYEYEPSKKDVDLYFNALLE